MRVVRRYNIRNTRTSRTRQLQDHYEVWDAAWRISVGDLRVVRMLGVFHTLYDVWGYQSGTYGHTYPTTVDTHTEFFRHALLVKETAHEP